MRPIHCLPIALLAFGLRASAAPTTEARFIVELSDDDLERFFL